MFQELFRKLSNWIKEPTIEVTVETTVEAVAEKEKFYVSELQKEVQEIAKSYGVKCIVRDNGHITLKKDFIVSYWPDSRKRTAYVRGAGKSVRDCTPKDAVLMTMKRNDIEKPKTSI